MAELRELRTGDAEAVATLLRDASEGDRAVDAEEVRSWLRQSLMQDDDRRVLADGGAVAGYADVFVREELAYLDIAGPGYEDTVLDWAECRAAERGATRVRLPLLERQTDLAQLIARRGYARARSSFELLIELGEAPPPAPVWPEGIDVHTYREADEQAVYDTQEEAFRDEWDHRPQSIEMWREFERNARGFDPSLWFLAREREEVAGILLAYPERVGDTGLGWVGIVGVRRPWRQRGLGEALLRHAFRELHARGLRRVGLGVDAESPTGAARLYERVGMRVRTRSDSWDKRL